MLEYVTINSLPIRTTPERIGKYEEETTGNVTRKMNYIYGGNGLAAIYVQNSTGSDNLWFTYTDYKGSLLALAERNGTIVEEYAYDPWGKRRNPADWKTSDNRTLKVNRGYTLHEHLPEFNLINMNGRMYDPQAGLFLSPDPYVQAPENWMNYNRYSYALNNPLIYTDPSGEFIFSFIPFIGPVLDGICWGAAIGAATSAVSYTMGAALSGNWSSSGFWNSIGMGAIGGALGGGFGALGGMGLFGTFGNTMGYNILNQAASNALTNTIFGNDITWGSLGGMVAGSLLGSTMPGFTATQGSPFKNAIAEIGFNSGKGALTGLASGLVQASIDKNPDAIWKNTLGGAINGASSSILNISIFGPAIDFDDSYIGHPKGEGPIYRKSGIASFLGGAGINWGRTAWVNGLQYSGIRLDAALLHEGTHWWQQKLDGFGTFYGNTTKNYLQSIRKYGNTWPLYTGKYNPYNYEHMAQTIEYLYLNSKGYNYPIIF